MYGDPLICSKDPAKLILIYCQLKCNVTLMVGIMFTSLYYDITVDKMLFCKTASFLRLANFAVTSVLLETTLIYSKPFLCKKSVFEAEFVMPILLNLC